MLQTFQHYPMCPNTTPINPTGHTLSTRKQHITLLKWITAKHHIYILIPIRAGRNPRRRIGRRRDENRRLKPPRRNDPRRRKRIPYLLELNTSLLLSKPTPRVGNPRRALSFCAATCNARCSIHVLPTLFRKENIPQVSPTPSP